MKTGGEYWVLSVNRKVVIDKFKKFGIVECHDVGTGEKMMISTGFIIDDDHCKNFDAAVDRLNRNLDSLETDLKLGLKRRVNVSFCQIALSEASKTMESGERIDRYAEIAERHFKNFIKETNRALYDFKEDLSTLRDKMYAEEEYNKIHQKEGDTK